MKSYNLDYLLEDDNTIRNAIITCCKSKKKKKNQNNNKYYLAQRILNNVEHYVPLIKEHIRNYVPSKVHTFQIIEKYSKKVRDITTIPLFPDQIIHQLIVDIIKPILLKCFYDHSYASIPGRGTHKGKKYIDKIIKNKPKDVKYMDKLDIKKCYKHISHNLLKIKFRKMLRGFKLFNLICKVLDNYHDFIINKEAYGIPIGFSTSQWFCNFLLTSLDYFAKQVLKIKIYVRYMDDIFIAHRNKKTLHKIQKSLINFLSNIKLGVKNNYQVFRFVYKTKIIIKDKIKEKGRFLDFLGFKFYRDRTTIRKHIFINLIKQAKFIRKAKSNISFKIASGYMSRFSYVKHTNSYNLFKKYLNKIKIYKIKEVLRNESRKLTEACC